MLTKWLRGFGSNCKNYLVRIANTHFEVFVVVDHSRSAERIREGQIDVKQCVSKEVVCEPYGGVPFVNGVHGVEYTTDYEHVSHRPVFQADVPDLLDGHGPVGAIAGCKLDMK